MTYNVFSGMLNPTHSINQTWKQGSEIFETNIYVVNNCIQLQ